MNSTEPKTQEPITSIQAGETKLWHRLALGAILCLSALLAFYQLDQIGYANSYYAAGIKSMLTSWQNFFFVSFDPGGFVSIDKPPLGFWIQALSAKLFGFSGISIMLPQVLATIGSVALLYWLVRRILGPEAGLLAALFLALTPISVVTGRNNTIDSQLVFVVLLGAWAVFKAIETGRLRWLLLCALLVGLGFNIKMLQAYLVVPAFGLVYLLSAPHTWWKRLIHLAAALAVLLAISLSWAVTVDLIPASQRPYVGSSQTNSAVELAFGYNGLQRLLGMNRDGGSQQAPSANQQQPQQSNNQGTQPPDQQDTQSNRQGQSMGMGMFGTGTPGPLRLFSQELGGQASWLLALALIGLLVGIWKSWPAGIRLPLGRQQQALVVWGVWLLTVGTFFSVAGFFHHYYLVMLSPAISALAAIGLILLWQEYRRAGWSSWLLPLALIATAIVQASLLLPFAESNQTLIMGTLILTLSLTLLSALFFVAARFIPRIRKRSLLYTGVSIAVLGMLLAPGVWTGTSLASGSSGGLPQAGPMIRDGLAMRGTPPGNSQSAQNNQPASPTGPVMVLGGGPQSNKQLEQYLLDHQGDTRFLVATPSSGGASSFILDTGKPVMALGGFSGGDPILSADELAELVANNTVRFFLLSSGGMGGGPGGDRQAANTWVTTHCTIVPASEWQSTSSQEQIPGGMGGQQQLYDCANPKS